jgi:T-complex protein 1 subunit eta
MQNAFQPQIILLREGTDTSQGKSQIISNINACQAVAETIKTTLGPRGMDKLVFDGQRTTISNDGATIMRLLDIVHPAAKTLVDISMAQVSFDRIYKFKLNIFSIFNFLQTRFLNMNI